MRRILALSTIGLVGLLAAGCALPTKEEWAQIRQHGFIPVMMDSRGTAVASTAARPSAETAVRVQAVSTPVVVRTPYAEPVPGRPGFVFSPYATPRRVVDVRGFGSGEEARCPFTTQPFLIPDFKAVATATKPVSIPLRDSVAEVVSNSPDTALLDERLSRLEAPPEPSAASPVPVDAASPAPASQTGEKAEKVAIPPGIRVPGRPGFVYSPHADRTQLVDVAGTAPGVVVKCPYTHKLFRVPEEISEEVKPVDSPATPADDPNGSPPAAPEKKAPAPVEPAAPVSPDPAPGSPR